MSYWEINYKGLNEKERVKTSYFLFGRIKHSSNEANKYYYKGLLEDIPFVRVGKGKIATKKAINIPVSWEDKINLILRPYDEIDLTKAKTAKQRIKEFCKRKGYNPSYLEV